MKYLVIDDKKLEELLFAGYANIRTQNRRPEKGGNQIHKVLSLDWTISKRCLNEKTRQQS